jgi:hypothetical protein
VCVAGNNAARALATALVCVIALALGSCGGERTFEADEFVEDVNEHGAGVELGEPLSSAETGHEIFAVELAASATQVHGGGSLVVTGDSEEAQAEHARCESAASLTCYRAANVVLRLEEVSPDQRAKLDQAFTELESE